MTYYALKIKSCFGTIRSLGHMEAGNKFWHRENFDANRLFKEMQINNDAYTKYGCGCLLEFREEE